MSETTKNGTAPREGAGAVCDCVGIVDSGHARECPAHAADDVAFLREISFRHTALERDEGARLRRIAAALSSASPAPAPAGEDDAALLRLVASQIEDHWRLGNLDGEEVAARLRALAAALAEVRADRERLVECVAEAVYDAMRETDPEGRRYPWVPGGNSTKQDEARRRARRAIDAARRAGAASSTPRAR